MTHCSENGVAVSLFYIALMSEFYCTILQPDPEHAQCHLLHCCQGNRCPKSAVWHLTGDGEATVQVERPAPVGAGPRAVQMPRRSAEQ